jgi:hypothetical protein
MKTTLPKLTIELVPETCFYKNLRSVLPKRLWDYLRKGTYAKAGNRCEICGGDSRLECHEIFSYDDETYIQKIIGLIALCNKCHSAKHIGLSRLRGNGREAEEHLRKVNGWSERETQEYIGDAFDVWALRSRHKWNQDLSWLEKFGITEKDFK